MAKHVVPFRYRCRYSLILMQDIVMHERMLPIDTVGDQNGRRKQQILPS